MNLRKARPVNVVDIVMAASMRGDAVKGARAADGLLEGLDGSIASEVSADRRPSRDGCGQTGRISVRKRVGRIGGGQERYEDIARAVGARAQTGSRQRRGQRRTIK